MFVLFVVAILGAVTYTKAQRLLSVRQERHPVIDPTRLHASVVGQLVMHDFNSAVFGNTRKLRVLLPPGYDDPANLHRRYPVLYLADGQNLFDSRTSSSTVEWGVDETVSALVSQGKIPPMIVVGMDNGGKQRVSEYLPYPHWVDRKLAAEPRGMLFPQFVVDEVMPFINSHYRTRTGPEFTGLGGSSLGGLVSVYAAEKRPGHFGMLLVESATLYVDYGHIFKDGIAVSPWPHRVSIGVGTNEGNRKGCPPDTGKNRMVDDARHLAEVIHQGGVDTSNIRVVVAECANHSEASWGRRFPAALEFLFGPLAAEK